MLTRSRKAFTLIELLIVVAIIAILAAIAVPNFLEAQVRAKVSRIKSDLRTTQVALESYFVDTNHLPLCTYSPFNPPSGTYANNERWKIYPGYPSAGLAGSVTTPVSYLSSRAPLVDIFRKAHGWKSPLANEIMYLPTEFYSDTTPYTGLKGPYNFAYGTYVIRSAGPDTWYQNLPGHNEDYGEISNQWNLATYDPTNGTVSAGDIYRSQANPEHTHI